MMRTAVRCCRSQETLAHRTLLIDDNIAVYLKQVFRVHLTKPACYANWIAGTASKNFRTG